MKHEQQTLEKVMQARSGVSSALGESDVAALGQAETKMRQGLMNLFAVAEAYPDLKANESFQSIQQRITQLENKDIQLDPAEWQKAVWLAKKILAETAPLDVDNQIDSMIKNPTGSRKPFLIST